MTKTQIFQIFGSDYRRMTVDVLTRSDLAALIPGPGSRICIKPNLVISKPASEGATTHPEVVAGIIAYLRANGFSKICLAEGCWIGEDSDACFEKTGFRKLCAELDVPLIDIRKRGSHWVDCAGMPLKVSDVVNDVDFLINAPVMKGHCQVRMTCALKNVKGLVPDDEKRRFHKLGINEPVGRLSAGLRQDFIVVDGICGDPAFEEGGNPCLRNCIMTARDPVLLDAYSCRLFHLPVEQVPYVGIAERAGVGSTDLTKAEIVTLGAGSAELPVAARVFDVSYAVDAEEACSACYANLLPCLAKLQEEGLLELLEDRIAIGQNHRGKSGRLGIGNCTACFDTCIRGCPATQKDIYAGLRDYILRKTENT